MLEELMTPKARLIEIKDKIFNWSIDVGLFGRDNGLTDKHVEWMVNRLDRIVEALESIIDDL